MKRHPRSRSRGAVLAEATIVVTTLAVFFGGITFLHRGLAAKLDAQHDTRQHAFDASNKNCESSGDSSPKNTSFSSSEEPLMASGPAEDPDVSDVLKLFISAQTPFDFNTTSAVAERNVDGSVAAYSRDAAGNSTFKANPLSTTLKGSSWVMCNPAPRDGNVDGFFEFGKDYFTSHITNLGELISGMFQTFANAVKGLFGL